MGKQYSIKEVASLLGINANKIRFYEKKGLINPERDEENDYRYFNDEEVIKLHSILLYRALGLSVKDIEGLLKNTTKENYLEHFYNQWKVVNDKIHELSQMRGALEHIMDEMYLVTDRQYTIEVLTEIQHNVEKITVKNNWKDKWAFDNWARNYDTDIKVDRGSLKIYENYEILLDGVVKSAIGTKTEKVRVLDIGVGTGNLAKKLYDLGHDVTGVDQSRAMLEVAKSKNSGLKVRLGEFLKLPFENKSFDIIVSTYAFHHLDEKEKEVALEEMIRVLVDDGVIVIGDLMFESDEVKSKVYATFTDKQIDCIEDEYYTNINKLEKYVGDHARKINKLQIDRLCWIVTICK